jgi:hypothetical protein
MTGFRKARTGKNSRHHYGQKLMNISDGESGRTALNTTLVMAVYYAVCLIWLSG